VVDEKLVKRIKLHMEILQRSGKSTAEWFEILHRAQENRLTNRDWERIYNEL
jgi:hypothetical protein